MVRWCDNLYIDEIITPYKMEVIKKIEKGIFQKGIYVIAIASNDKNLFDIINANELQLNYYKKRDIKVVAIAGNKQNAVLLVSNIVEDMYKKTKNIYPKDYFSFT